MLLIIILHNIDKNSFGTQGVSVRELTGDRFTEVHLWY
jgi:hypothetical protein